MGQRQLAKSLLIELVTDVVVPQYIRFDSWTLLSFCTDDMNMAEHFLRTASRLCEEMCSIKDTQRVQEGFHRTDRMLQQVEGQRRYNMVNHETDVLQAAPGQGMSDCMVTGCFPSP